MTFSQVTASSSLDALAAAADAAARAALRTLNAAGRERHSPRAQKARPKFRHTTATKKTVTRKPRVTVFAPSQALTAAGQEPLKKGGTAPAARARTVEPRHPPRHAGKHHARIPPPPSPKQTQRQKQGNKAVTL